MSKARKSKLDEVAAEVMGWFEEEHLKYSAAQARLKERGISVSISRLCAWHSTQQERRLQERVLQSITSGAELVSSVERQFGKTPPPQTASLVKLLRVLIMNLSAHGTVDGEFLKSVGPLLSQVMDWERLQLKRDEVALSERRVRLLEEAAEKAKAKLAEVLKGPQGGLSAETLRKIEEAAGML